MVLTITPEESKELERLWREYWTATERVLEIMRTEGTDGATVLKIVIEDSKAGAAIKRIQEIYRGEGKSTLFEGTRPPPKIKQALRRIRRESVVSTTGGRSGRAYLTL